MANKRSRKQKAAARDQKEAQQIIRITVISVAALLALLFIGFLYLYLFPQYASTLIYTYL